MNQEEIVWSGSPSQIVNLKAFAGGALVCSLLILLFTTFWKVELVSLTPAVWGAFLGSLTIPVSFMVWKWLVVKNLRFEITTQRLRVRAGVLNKTTAELELYRVKDFRVDQPLFLRLLGFSNIVLVSSDRTHPYVVIPAVPYGIELGNTIRENVEGLRRNLGIREFG